MFAGKDAAAHQVIDLGASIPARDEDAFAGHALLVVPQHGDAVGGVLAVYADERWQDFWPDVFKPDQADAGDSATFIQFWSETRRQETLDGHWVNTIVDENATANGSFYGG